MKEKNIDEYYKILKNDLTKYTELKLNYLKLEFIETFSTVFSKIISVWVTIMVGIIFFSFILIALAFYLGKILGAYHWGFLIVGGIFLLTGIIFFLLRNTLITNPLISSFMELLFFDKSKSKLKNDRKKI